jgi:ABC-type phosphate/phosphonate transport system substrate-binding protein
MALVMGACGDDDAATTTTTAGTTTTTTAEWPETLVFGFVPSQEAGELQDEIDTFAAILSDALDIEWGIVSTDYRPGCGAR